MILTRDIKLNEEEIKIITRIMHNYAYAKSKDETNNFPPHETIDEMLRYFKDKMQSAFNFGFAEGRGIQPHETT